MTTSPPGAGPTPDPSSEKHDANAGDVPALPPVGDLSFGRAPMPGRKRCSTVLALQAGMFGFRAPADSAVVRCAEEPDSSASSRGRFGPARLSDPGDFIAAIPAMLGFRPEQSLVLGILAAASADSGSAVLDVVVRFDLRHESDGQRVPGATLATLAAPMCVRPGCAGVLAVVVDDEANQPASSAPGQDPAVAALQQRLAADDVALHGAWAVRSIGPRQRWWSVLGTDRRGWVPDPRASAVTVSHVLDGRQVRGDRAELTAVIAVETRQRARVSAELDAALERAHERYVAAARSGEPMTYSRGALNYVLWQIANIDSGALLSPREIAEIVAALRDRHVRDTMFALASTAQADAAERLWAEMTRTVPEPDRAEAAALLGYCAYVRGDGPLAGVALEAALAAESAHPMATLLQTALGAGMRPSQLRKLAWCGREAAADLGIHLGPSSC